jgi:2-C-methyl-D-erythritol 4-phosphate cytidylyltransferase
VENILLVAGESVREAIASWSQLPPLSKPLQIVAGGAERYLSVHEGLRHLPERCRTVAVHDGARPLIRAEQISRCIARAQEVDAVACARPVSETLKRVDLDGIIAGSIDREGVWIMETPQVFDRLLLCKAYERVVREALPVTDEVSAVQHLGASVFTLSNPWPNPKITYPADIPFAETLLRTRADVATP